MSFTGCIKTPDAKPEKVELPDDMPIKIKNEQELRALIQRWKDLDADAVVDFVVRKLSTEAAILAGGDVGIIDRKFLTSQAIEMAPLLITVAEEQAAERKKNKTSSFLEDFFGEGET